MMLFKTGIVFSVDMAEPETLKRKVDFQCYSAHEHTQLASLHCGPDSRYKEPVRHEFLVRRQSELWVGIRQDASFAAIHDQTRDDSGRRGCARIRRLLRRNLHIPRAKGAVADDC